MIDFGLYKEKEGCKEANIELNEIFDKLISYAKESDGGNSYSENPDVVFLFQP